MTRLGLLKWAVLLLAISGTSANAATAPSPPAMIAPGQFSVSATGAATYTMPIAVPPGSAGMVPALSLDYSSQNGDGIEGIGWTLSGLPSISRCPRTLAQDSIHGSVNYDSNDRFCMDGQRLILTSGTYGADGSEYRTEIESFSRIIAHGSAGAGPAWFEVHTKSGQIMQFGNTADSQILVVSATSGVTATARAWAVNKISDTVGNYLTITYNSASSSDRVTYGEAYPIRVDYTGNASASPSVSPYNSVQFFYSSRSDSIPLYQAGGITQTTVLLTDIKTYQGANLVYDYQLAYRAGTSTTRSRLTSVTLCDNASHCLAPTTFGWQGGTGSLSMGTTASPLTEYYVIPVPGEWNGDGLTDLATAFPGCSPYPIYLGTSTIGSFNPSSYSIDSSAEGADDGCAVPEFSSSIMAPNGTTWVQFTLWGYWKDPYGGPDNVYAYTSIGSGSQAYYDITPEVGLAIPTLPALAGDYNGDGKNDFFLQANPITHPILTASYPWIGDGSGGFTQTGSGYTGFNQPTTALAVADFDGDGCTDIYGQTSSAANIEVYMCNPAVTSASAPYAAGYTPVFGDFNGDGKTDILLVSKTSAAQLWLSTGTGFVEVTGSLPSDWGKYSISVGDWNGDGKADILLVASGASGQYGSGTSHKLYVSTGTDLVQAVDGSGAPITIPNSTSCTTSSACVSATIADWNNDGASDILVQSCNGGWVTVCTSTDFMYTFSHVPELMTSVSNGINSTTNISYAPLNTNGTFYTKGTGATYPTQDVDGALYVVSQVDASNGLGTCSAPGGSNCYTSTYAYAGAQSDLNGRGFLGFASTTVSDSQTGVVQTTNYCTLFPLTGQISSQAKVHGGVTLNSIMNAYNGVGGCMATAPSGVVELTESQVVSNDLDNTPMPTVTTDYTYDSYGSALTVNVAVSDGSSKDTTNTYSNDTTNWYLGRLLTTTVNSVVGASSLSRSSSFSYDPSNGLLTQEVVEPGVSSCNGGGSSSCTVTTDYTYDAFGHKITSTVSGSGIATRASYTSWDALGEFQMSATNALGQSETWIYDARFGVPTSHTGPNGLVTKWTYDTFGRNTLETRPDGTQTTKSYAYCSGVAGGSASCPTGGSYVATAQMFASNGTTQIGPTGSIYYDMLSRSIANDVQGYDGSNVRVATQYDVNGRVQQTTRPYFTAGGIAQSTSFAYDDLGRVTQATFPDSSTSTYAFHGPSTSVTNNLGQTTTTIKNAQGLTATVIDAYSKQTTYVYDAFGNVLTVTDPASNVVTNTYDIRGNKTSSSDPDMGSWSYTYDVLGELVGQTDAKGQSSSLEYDVLGRMIVRSEADLYSTWTYGATVGNHNVGQLIEAKACTDSSCSTLVSDRSFTFDSLGRPSVTVLSTLASSDSFTTAYNTTNGKVQTVLRPSGFTEKFLYNTYGYECRVTDNGGSPTCTSAANGHVLWTTNSRDAELHATQSTAGNGVVINQTFDPATGRPVCTFTGATCTSTGTDASLSYTFDTIGNLTSRTDSNESFTEQFCYDNLNRLTNYAIGVSCTSPGTTTVAYDSIGNITEKSDLCASAGCYAYPLSGSSSVRPHAVSSITGTVNGVTNPNYQYDANGNLNCTYTGASCIGGATQSVTLTSFNMASVINQGSTTVTLTYDSEHARLRQVTLSGGVTTTTDYLNDPASGAMSERVSAGTATPVYNDYLTVDGKIVAQRTTKLSPTAPLWGTAIWNSFSWTASAASTVTSTYFILDHLGSVAVVTGNAGVVVQRLSYDAWGKARNPNGTAAACGLSSPTTRGFTNQEQVAAVCLVNLNARFYDPTIGKFLAADPMVGDPEVPNAFNRYAYVLNNPLSFTDPTGLCFLGCFWKQSWFLPLFDIALFAVGLPELEANFNLSIPDAFAAVGPQGLVANAVAAGAISSGVSGGNIIQGALNGGLTELATLGLGGPLSNVLGHAVGSTVGDFVGQGLAGGIVSIAEGGNFGSGFLAAGFGTLTGPLGLSPGSQFSPGGLIESAALGGVGSVLGGGKFANGAVTGAFSYAAGASYANDNSNRAPSNQYAANDNGVRSDAMPVGPDGCDLNCTLGHKIFLLPLVEIEAAGDGLADIIAGGIRVYDRLMGVPQPIPRPDGIPDDWVSQSSNKGGGTEYINPANSFDRVRVMPGNPNSSNAAQQNPYVIDQINGRFLTTNGTRVQGSNVPETHIPLSNYQFER